MNTQIPLLDLKKQISPMRKEIDRAIKKVIDGNSFILGPEVKLLERNVSSYCNVKFAQGVSNGTDAIRLALLALNIKPGDKVICPTFTYYATAGAIAAIGAIPVFSDIDPRTYNISVEAVESILNKDRGRKIKAIIIVHLYGQCSDIYAILKIARRYKVKVIEDTAQAFGAKYFPKANGNKAYFAGTLGDCNTVSFFPGKNLGAFGDAGMVLTNNKAVANSLTILRNQGNRNRYFHLVCGHNNRMDDIQAAVLNVKLKYLNGWNKKRQANAAYYDKKLKGTGAFTPYVPDYTSHIYHQYVLQLPFKSAKLIAHLRGRGVDARVYYPLPLHLQRCFKYLGYKPGDFPESEKAARNILAIPVHPDLKKGQMDYIINSIKEFLNA